MTVLCIEITFVNSQVNYHETSVTLFNVLFRSDAPTTRVPFSTHEEYSRRTATAASSHPVLYS